MVEQYDDLKRTQYPTDWDLSDVKNMQDILKEELAPANWGTLAMLKTWVICFIYQTTLIETKVMELV